LIVDSAELFVTGENCPIPYAVLSFTAEPIVLSDAKVVHAEHTCSDCWNIAEQNVAENVIPPALSEVRQDVLHGELDYFIE